MSKRPNVMKVMLEANMANIIIYMAVAEETLAGIPKLSKIGLKIIPPPIPTVVAIMLPKKERITKVRRVLPLNLTSVSTNPLSYFIFKSCCFLVIL